MPTALVLLNVELGAESIVLENLRKIDAVKEAYRVFGVYDTIAEIEADTMEELKEIVSLRVRTIDKVRQTLTMIAIK